MAGDAIRQPRTRTRSRANAGAFAALAVAALVVLALQIALGGWTSSNYAALACPDFPTCQNSLWPQMDVKDAFVLWRGLGIDYEGGVLDHPARVAIHFVHRLGAVLAALMLGFAEHCWLAARPDARRADRRRSAGRRPDRAAHPRAR